MVFGNIQKARSDVLLFSNVSLSCKPFCPTSHPVLIQIYFISVVGQVREHKIKENKEKYGLIGVTGQCKINFKILD